MIKNPMIAEQLLLIKRLVTALNYLKEHSDCTGMQSIEDVEWEALEMLRRHEMLPDYAKSVD